MEVELPHDVKAMGFRCLDAQARSAPSSQIAWDLSRLPRPVLWHKRAEKRLSSLAGYRASPINKTTSASPSPTAAKMKRLSEDHDTRRAMKVGRWPKSVSWRIGTPEVGRAQMFVVGPSLSSRASEFPSGEITGCSNCQEGMREPGMRASTREGPFSGRATRISTSETPLTPARETP